MSTPAVELLIRSFDVLSAGDLDAAVELLTDDFIINYPGMPQMTGRDAWRGNAGMFLAAFPDLHVTVDDAFGEGDKVAVRLTFRGTHRGDFMGIAPTGREVSFSSVELYRVEGDKIAEEWVSPDIQSLMGQISSATP